MQENEEAQTISVLIVVSLFICGVDCVLPLFVVPVVVIVASGLSFVSAF